MRRRLRARAAHRVQILAGPGLFGPAHIVDIRRTIRCRFGLVEAALRAPDGSSPRSSRFPFLAGAARRLRGRNRRRRPTPSAPTRLPKWTISDIAMLSAALRSDAVASRHERHFRCQAKAAVSGRGSLGPDRCARLAPACSRGCRANGLCRSCAGVANGCHPRPGRRTTASRGRSDPASRDLVFVELQEVVRRGD